MVLILSTLQFPKSEEGVVRGFLNTELKELDPGRKEWFNSEFDK